MNDSKNKADVSIVGNGFAGLNVARLLSKNGKSFQINSSGFGASQFWAGSLDFLKYTSKKHPNKLNIQEKYINFCKKIDGHPYNLIGFNVAKRYLDNFLSDFGEFESSTNNRIITMLGLLKPCYATWKSIFSEFDSCDENTNIILIDFSEFNNSSMHLVASGMNVNIGSKTFILNLDLFSIFELFETDLNKYKRKKISESMVASIFDNNLDKIEIIGNLIRENINKTLPNNFLESEGSTKTFIIFPPILGIKYWENILEQLTKFIGAPCFETAAVTPSLMGKRLSNSFLKLIPKKRDTIFSGQTLIGLERRNDAWISIFENYKKETKEIESEKIIIASGSLFMSGILSSLPDFYDKISSIFAIKPEKIYLDANFELILKDKAQIVKTGIHICGSATYMFMGNLTDEEEIKYCTGLGLAIITSAQVVEYLLNQK